MTCLVIEEKKPKLSQFRTGHAAGSGDDGEHSADAAGPGFGEAHGRAGP